MNEVLTQRPLSPLLAYEVTCFQKHLFFWPVFMEWTWPVANIDVSFGGQPGNDISYSSFLSSQWNSQSCIRVASSLTPMKLPRSLNKTQQHLVIKEESVWLRVGRASLVRIAELLSCGTVMDVWALTTSTLRALPEWRSQHAGGDFVWKYKLHWDCLLKESFSPTTPW